MLQVDIVFNFVPITQLKSLFLIRSCLTVNINIVGPN